jgi:hypothetical protein
MEYPNYLLEIYTEPHSRDNPYNLQDKMMFLGEDVWDDEHYAECGIYQNEVLLLFVFYVFVYVGFVYLP